MHDGERIRVEEAVKEGTFDLGKVLVAATGRVGLSGGDVEFWTTRTFAPDWYNDAKREAMNPEGAHSLRRQIAFAVALAETYLFEWVRDCALKGPTLETASCTERLVDRMGVPDRSPDLCRRERTLIIWRPLGRPTWSRALSGNFTLLSEPRCPIG